jgi:hypothetical protein
MRRALSLLFTAAFVALGWSAGAQTIPNVPDAARDVTYNIVSPTTNFSIPFAIYGDCTDLTVTVNNVTQNPSAYSCITTSGPSFATAPRPVTNAQVQFAVAVPSGAVRVTGAWHPRFTMGSASGITRNEFNRTLGTILTRERETYDFMQSVVAGPGGPIAITNSQVIAALGYAPLSPANLGVAGGLATLDPAGFVPISQLPPAVAGGLTFQGNWNASTNTPTLASGVGGLGQYYFVAVSGTTTIDGVSSWTAGDLLLFSSGVWNRIPGIGTGSVTSVAGLTGVIAAANLRTALFASGNLLFGTTGQRITGDSTNATLANQLAFQNSVVNGNTSLNVIPNGSSSISALVLYSTSGMINGNQGGMIQNGNETRVYAGIIGTGTYGPETFWTNNAERMRLDTSGRLGIGRTPTASPLEVQGNVFTNGVLLLNTTAGAGGAGGQVNSFSPGFGATTPAWFFLEGNTAAPAGGLFHEPFVVQENNGGTGNHGTFTAIMNSSASNTGDQLPALQGFSTIMSGSSGSAFGGNSVAIAASGALSGSEIVAHEFNTTAAGTVTRKAGLHIVDTGTGAGSTLDFGIGIGRGASGIGYQSGIVFDVSPAANNPGVKAGGNLIVGPSSGVAVGIDFLNTVFSGFAIRSNGFDVTGAGQVDASAVNISGTTTLNGNALSGLETSTAVTVTCSSGTISSGTLTGTAHYKRLADKSVLMNVDVVVSNPFTGTCAFPVVALPGGMTAHSAAVFVGRETVLNGLAVSGTLPSTGANMTFARYDNANPIVAGATFTLGAHIFVN